MSVEDNDTLAVNLTKVEVIGSDSFSNEFFKKLLNPLLSTSDQTVSDLINNSNNVISNLHYSDCFNSIKFSINEDEESKKVTDVLGEMPMNLNAKIILEEDKIQSFRLNSKHETFGHILSAGYYNKNAFGNAEHFQASTIFNLVEDNEARLLDLTYKAPMLNTSLKMYSHLLFANEANKCFQSKQQLTSLIQFGLQKYGYCNCSKTNTIFSTGISLARRSIYEIADSADDEIKTYAGDNMKESLYLNLYSSNMKFLPLSVGKIPLNGFTVESKNELAGFSSLVDSKPSKDKQDQFIKFQINSQYAISTPCKTLTLTSGLNFAKIIDLSATTVHFKDKLYPKIPGYTRPLGIAGSIGAMSNVEYSLGLLTKCLFAKTDSPLRLYGKVVGGFVDGEILKHGIDAGLIYECGELASARVFWNFGLNDGGISRAGFEVSLTGDF